MRRKEKNQGEWKSKEKKEQIYQEAKNCCETTQKNRLVLFFLSLFCGQLSFSNIAEKSEEKRHKGKNYMMEVQLQTCNNADTSTRTVFFVLICLTE